MILQRRQDSLRAITQHEHALLSGELAQAWRGLGDAPEALPMATVMAIALHDMAWLDADASWSHAPPFDAERGAPHDFITLPLEDRLRIYSAGLDDVARLHPRVGWLISRHYASFLPEREAPTFNTREETRREALLPRVDPAGLDHDFAVLQLLDILSLYLCMAPPGTRDLPPWLTPEMTLEGETIRASWRDAGRALALTPFPFAEPVSLRVPSRVLPSEPFADASALALAYASAERREDVCVVEPA